MRVVDCEQGTAAWLEARLGLPTASRFGSILTPSGKPSSAAEGYLHQLAAERLLGVPVDSASSDFMERGKALEQEACAWFELQRGTDTEKVGFVLTDDGRAGCSPDRFVGTDGGLEIKAPSAAAHVGYLLDDIPTKFKPQVQGCMWVTGRSHWWVLSYHPMLPSALVRIERDEAFIEALESAVMAFCDRLDEATERLRALTGMAAA